MKRPRPPQQEPKRSSSPSSIPVPPCPWSLVGDWLPELRVHHLYPACPLRTKARLAGTCRALRDELMGAFMCPLWLPDEWRRDMAYMTSTLGRDSPVYGMSVPGTRELWRPQSHVERRLLLRQCIEKRLRPLGFLNMRPDLGRFLRLEYATHNTNAALELKLRALPLVRRIDDTVCQSRRPEMQVTLGYFFETPHLPLLIATSPALVNKASESYADLLRFKEILDRGGKCSEDDLIHFGLYMHSFYLSTHDEEGGGAGGDNDDDDMS